VYAPVGPPTEISMSLPGLTLDWSSKTPFFLLGVTSSVGGTYGFGASSFSSFSSGFGGFGGSGLTSEVRVVLGRIY